MCNIEEELRQAFPEWSRVVKISFLSDEKKKGYVRVLEQRKQVLGR